MPLIIHSKSTKKYAEQLAKEYNNVRLIDVSTIDKPQPSEDPMVIGIGGGKVIDYAKIMAGQHQAIAIPTTAAGASATSHAVFWDSKTKRKIDIPTKMPKIRVEPSFLEMLPKKMLKTTSYDALSHALESYWSNKATKESEKLSRKAHAMLVHQIENNYDDVVSLIRAGNLAGAAINITGTNMVHALSYPLTALYNVSHGAAVGWALRPCAEYQECDLYIPSFEVILEKVKIDREFIKTLAKEAMTYNKIHDAKKDITEKQLVILLESRT